MTQSVELLLDARTDRAVRGQWDALVEAQLPSQARHTGASNAPHVTLAARRSIDPEAEASLAGAVDTLPLPVRLGAVTVFGRDPYVLVRLVVASRDLLDLQARVHEVLGADPRTDHHVAPGHWTPHVTLARRLDADQVATALRALGSVPDLDATAVSARRWDGDAKVEWPLTPPADPELAESCC